MDDEILSITSIEQWRTLLRDHRETRGPIAAV